MDRRKARWIGAGLVALGALGGIVWALPGDEREAPEVCIRLIPLGGGIELPEAEISGLAWYRDSLVLLPQYPARFPSPEGRGSLLTLERSDIEAFLDGLHPGPLTVRRVPLLAPELEEQIPGFDGFEAIVFADDRVFVTVEARRDAEATVGWLVAGRVEGELEEIVLDPARRARLRAQNELFNIGYEALVLFGDDALLAIYETNGEVNPRPTVLAFDLALRPRAELPLRHLEYRVTDATEVDSDGRFWVANYHWPGSSWDTAACEITAEYGQGASHARCHAVERLVELSVSEAGIAPTARPPVLLELIDDEHARNWEGLVRLPGRGFLLMTDEHPASILAFVPFVSD